MENNIIFELLGTNEVELSYLAGLFDGEGCISVVREIRRNKEKVKLAAEVGMTEIAPLYIFNRVFGGSIITRAPRKSGHKEIYRWRVQGTKAQLFLKSMEPYLIVKKEKAILGLSLANYIGLQSPNKNVIADKISQRRILPNYRPLPANLKGGYHGSKNQLA